MLKLKLFAALLLITSQSFAATVFSDFTFLNGSPVTGQTILSDGTVVTVNSTNTEKFGATAFRDLLDTQSASVVFDFSRNISDFSLDVERVFPQEEWLTSFSIGLPDSLSGTLFNDGGLITSSGSDDFGFGKLSWSNLDTNTVSFVIGNAVNSIQPLPPALGLTQFGTSAAVSLPATILLLLGGGLIMRLFKY